jgi:hypothetical protein
VQARDADRAGNLGQRAPHACHTDNDDQSNEYEHAKRKPDLAGTKRKHGDNF